MQKFELTILGCSSATPTSQRHPTSQLLNIAERYCLIDCGEATQIQLRRFKIKFQKINHIFISHLHGDHYLGLMGLLASMHLLGRTKSLTLYCPPELQEIIEVQNKHSFTKLKYEIKYHHLHHDKPEILFEDDKIQIEKILMNHRINCFGFVFREKPLPRKLNKEKLEKYKVQPTKYKALQKGMDIITEDGTTVPNSELTEVSAEPRSYAFCSDTCYDESIIEKIKNMDLLYHEATFMQNMISRAKETYHSTTIQAGTIAKKANAGKLIIGHFSARYKDAGPLLDETKTVFENTVLAVEGERYEVEKFIQLST